MFGCVYMCVCVCVYVYMYGGTREVRSVFDEYVTVSSYCIHVCVCVYVRVSIICVQYSIDIMH